MFNYHVLIGGIQNNNKKLYIEQPHKVNATPYKSILTNIIKYNNNKTKMKQKNEENGFIVAFHIFL